MRFSNINGRKAERCITFCFLCGCTVPWVGNLIVFWIADLNSIPHSPCKRKSVAQLSPTWQYLLLIMHRVWDEQNTIFTPHGELLPSISKNIKLAPNSKTFVCTSSTFSYKPQQSKAFLKMWKQESSGIVLNIISFDYKGKLN